MWILLGVCRLQRSLSEPNFCSQGSILARFLDFRSQGCNFGRVSIAKGIFSANFGHFDQFLPYYSKQMTKLDRNWPISCKIASKVVNLVIFPIVKGITVGFLKAEWLLWDVFIGLCSDFTVCDWVVVVRQSRDGARILDKAWFVGAKQVEDPVFFRIFSLVLVEVGVQEDLQQLVVKGLLLGWWIDPGVFPVDVTGIEITL